MKLKHLAAALVLTAGTVFAQETASVRADVKQMHVYMPQSWAVRQGAMISNKLNAYEVILAMTKTNGKKPAETGIRIWAGDYGFCPLTQSFQLEVNGIPLKKLNVKASNVQPWKEGKNTGLKIALNFDGCKMDVIFYMRPDSPVLWGMVKPAADTLEEAEKVTLTFTCIPSTLARKNKVPVWGGPEYAREVVATTKTYPAHAKVYPLNKADTEYIFRDAKFDGSAQDKSKGQGPVWLQIDQTNVLKGVLRSTNEWTNWLRVELNPKMKDFKFGMWQQKAVISNADFDKKLKAEKAAFTR